MKTYAFPFDTRDKKPKLYNIAALTVLAALALAMLSQAGETARVQWGNVILALYFAAVVVLLADALFKQIRYNPYSYNTIIYTGFALFDLSVMITHIAAAVRAFLAPERVGEQQMIFTLLRSAKDYILLTAPLLLVFSVALFASNVSLIRHEGKRLVNLLGMLLAFLLTAGIAALVILDRWSDASTKNVLLLKLLVYLSGAFYLYFECMMVGAIGADCLAALYEPEKDKDFLIVLGCGLKKDGTPTPLLKGRLDQALEFYEEQLRRTGKSARFVVSGGQGPDEAQSEAASMRAYLLSRGVPEDRIVVEDKSTDTAENMRFSKEKIEELEKNARVAFFTTNYHVFRAGLKARRVKMRAVGMGAPTKWYFWPNASVREFVGLLTEHRWKQGAILFGLTAIYAVLTLLAYR